ncbi:MAG TPA: hypothetical protein PK629_00010 [Oscillospiraceae bacterium]|nr:hypothetical protein [Oscillospiraceae bacterium]HPK35487.1 hypothetical protein [Oscillospiraceae bacterium]
MIKVIGYSTDEVDLSTTYDQSARVLNIESSSMNDDCIPFRESTGCMVWIDKNKIPCEIECIFPVETKENNLRSNIEIFKGVPKIEISLEEKPIEISFDHSQLILIFNKHKVPNKKYYSSNCSFYVFEDELVAIQCINYKKV